MLGHRFAAPCGSLHAAPGSGVSPRIRVAWAHIRQAPGRGVNWYGPLGDVQARVEVQQRFGRPVHRTEFMARGLGSNFDPHLGWMRDAGVGADCWGFVQGRIQTEYPLDSGVKRYEEAPDPWFHDVLRTDGSPYDCGDVDSIRSLTHATG